MRSAARSIIRARASKWSSGPFREGARRRRDRSTRRSFIRFDDMTDNGSSIGDRTGRAAARDSTLGRASGGGTGAARLSTRRGKRGSIAVLYAFRIARRGK